MSLRSLNPENATLVIVDFQSRLLKIMDDEVTARSVVNINFFTRMFRRWNAPVIVTEQYTKGLGATHEPIASYLEGIEPIEKMVFSCCGEPRFMQALEQNGRRNIVLTGMETHICVLQTVLDLLARDYTVFVAEDAVQSSNDLRYQSGLKMMRKAGALVLPTESILYQMLGRCDTDDFKHMVGLIKESRS